MPSDTLVERVLSRVGSGTGAAGQVVAQYVVVLHLKMTARRAHTDTTMRILDLFCCAGGAAMGLHQGLDDLGIPHEIIGVDIEPQPRYPFTFVQADAMCPPFDLEQFDFIWASPPCQHYSKRNNHVKNLKDRYPDLVGKVRDMLNSTDKPYVIENVPRSPLDQPFVLCGSMFGLDIYRHRLFESNRFLLAPVCAHDLWEPNRFEGGRSYEYGSSKALCRSTVEIGRWGIPLQIQNTAMDIHWMNQEELSEAIPPAYSRYIIKQIFGNV